MPARREQADVVAFRRRCGENAAAKFIKPAPRTFGLAQHRAVAHPSWDVSWLFVVTEADAAAIRAAYERDGELSAAIDLRRLFPGIADAENARACVRSIAGWTPLLVPVPVPKVTRRSGKRRPRA